MRTRIKLSHYYSECGGLNNPYCEWILCAEKMEKFFEIPEIVDEITFVVSSICVVDAYKITLLGGCTLIVGEPGEVVVVALDLVKIIREYCEAGRDDHAYVWVEYDE